MVEVIRLIRSPTINNELPKDDEIQILKVEASNTWIQMNSLFLDPLYNNERYIRMMK